MTQDLVRIIEKTREHSLGDLLRRSAQREPNKPALGCDQVRWTFAERDLQPALPWPVRPRRQQGRPRRGAVAQFACLCGAALRRGADRRCSD